MMTALLGATFVVLAVLTAALGVAVHRRSTLLAAQSAAVQAARQEALNLTSVDSRDLDGSIARVLSGATGSFRDDLLSREATLRQVIPANRVLAQGEVVEAALVRGDSSSATVLVAVDATIRNVKVPDGRTNPYRMRLELQRVGSRWLTSNLQFVG